MSGSSPIESRKVLVGVWHWSQRGLSYCSPSSRGLGRNWPSLLIFFLGGGIFRREGLLGLFGFLLFSKARPRVAFLESGEYSWEGI